MKTEKRKYDNRNIRKREEVEKRRNEKRIWKESKEMISKETRREEKKTVEKERQEEQIQNEMRFSDRSRESSKPTTTTNNGGNLGWSMRWVLWILRVPNRQHQRRTSRPGEDVWFTRSCGCQIDSINEGQDVPINGG